MPLVYILKDSKNRVYIGSTTDLDRRLKEHQRGHTATTRRLDEVRFVWHKELSTLEEARNAERKIKKWKSRKMVELLIAGTINI
jgi:putative endonuclease